MSFIGVEEPRVGFAWISASEGAQFADTIRSVTEEVKALGPKKGLLGKRGEAS